MKDLGEDPVTKRNVTVRSGRFGLYVTDGEVNATLRLGDTPETLTLDRACELLAERRNAEPSARARKAPAKKTAARKAPAKKTTAKKAAPAKATGAAKRAATAKGARANATLAATTRREPS